MTISASELRKSLEAALVEVTAAETALDAALQQLRGGVRAEKVTVTSAMETAFARLRAAHAELARLREIVIEDDEKG
jgi:hypothetical protein